MVKAVLETSGVPPHGHRVTDRRVQFGCGVSVDDRDFQPFGASNQRDALSGRAITIAAFDSLQLASSDLNLRSSHEVLDQVCFDLCDLDVRDQVAKVIDRDDLASK